MTAGPVVPGRTDAWRPVRRIPYRLVAFAATLAALSMGVTAFATMDKTVRLDVDGRVVAVHTFASDVAGVLRKARLQLQPHDAVAPDLTAPVRDGSRVVVRRGRLLTLFVDGEQRQVWVTALSVDDALDQLGLRADGEWLSVSRSRAIPRQGLALALRLPQRVTVLVDGRRLATDTTAPDVTTLLADLGVTVGPLDHVNVPMTSYPMAGTVVAIDRISRRTVTETAPIPFRTVHVKTSALYVGQSQVSRPGQPGVRVNAYQLTWRNHKLAHRRLVHTQVRAKPVAEIVQVGTRPKPRYTPAADGLNWPALARCESGGNPRDVSADGKYRGLYQFTIGTWQGVGGHGDPIDASSNEQTYRAQLLYRRSGDSPWPTCGHYLYT
jgi:resuscitation-promoting factor RpfB